MIFFFTPQTPFYFCLCSSLYSAYINSASRLELLTKSFPRMRPLCFTAALLCWDLVELLGSDARDLCFAVMS